MNPAPLEAELFDDGTVFYLFTPFQGQLLRQVLDRLRAEATARRITVCTHGPCTRLVFQEAWLQPAGLGTVDNYKLAIFHSR